MRSRRRSHRRRFTTKSAAYYRRNPLSSTEYVIGGLVGVAVLGTGIYFLVQHFQSPTTASGALPAGAQVAAPGQFGSATAAGVDAYGNPLPQAIPYSATTG